VSNVLIGIIGVILFIGLALAGALFLGPRFQEASINSDAAIAMQGLQQLADAASLYESSTGLKLRDGDQDILLSEGYLKGLPRNPVNESGSYGTSFVLSYNWETPPVARPEVPAQFAVVFLYTGTVNPRTEKVCQAIARMTGQQSPINQWAPTDAAGCMQYSAGYVAFRKI
jgi:hypothetical protein